MPCSRHSSGTGTPFSACFRIDRTWLSEKRDFFMQNLPAGSLRKILLLSTVNFRGDYRRSKMKAYLLGGLLLANTASAALIEYEFMSEFQLGYYEDAYPGMEGVKTVAHGKLIVDTTAGTIESFSMKSHFFDYTSVAPARAYGCKKDEKIYYSDDPSGWIAHCGSSITFEDAYRPGEVFGFGIIELWLAPLYEHDEPLAHLQLSRGLFSHSLESAVSHW